jgi:N utilization substance protein B
LIIQAIDECISLRKASEERKINWVGDEKRELFRKMFLHIRDSEVFNTFMNNGRTGFEEDKEFALSLFKTEIANFPLLYAFFEEENIHWLDDIDLMCNMVIKSIKVLSEGKELEILPLYKPEDDEQEFVKKLLSKTLAMDAENELIIDELTKNWDLDRIAKMDIILMKMALTELQVFSNIPSSVTLNEYIEIAKFYSTPKSNGFINGILDKAILRLQKENKMPKIGRGLMK